MAGGQISPFPIDFHRRPYNTLALPCERVIRGGASCPRLEVWREAVHSRLRQPTTRSLRHQRHNFVGQRSGRVHYRDRPMDVSQ